MFFKVAPSRFLVISQKSGIGFFLVECFLFYSSCVQKWVPCVLCRYMDLGFVRIGSYSHFIVPVWILYFVEILSLCTWCALHGGTYPFGVFISGKALPMYSTLVCKGFRVFTFRLFHCALCFCVFHRDATYDSRISVDFFGFLHVW